jgi:hypothetical protein
MPPATVDLRYAPRKWQEQCHRGMKRFNVLALHRRAGKTELAIMQLIDQAIEFKRDLGLFVYIAPFLRQAKAIAWTRLKQKIVPLLDAVSVNEVDLSVTFKHNGATIRLFGGDNPDALRGVRLDGCVIDEVAQIKPEVWNDIVQPALSDRKGWAVFIGTPSGVNLFSELFYRAGDLADWRSALYTVYDTDALDGSEVERLRRDMPEQAFAREYLCDFSAAGDDQLISLSDVEAAARRVYKDGELEQLPRIVGVDPARFGDDRTVIFKRQGSQAFAPITLRGMDNMQVAARVAAVVDEWDADALFIDAGAGAGVIDRLRQMGYDPVEVPFGGKALLPDQFINRRTEMWWQMREWICTMGAIPNDATLKQELSTPLYWFDAQGRKVLEPKDEIKRRLQGGASPDMADALALTFAFAVRSRMPREIREKVQRRPSDHDPYTEFGSIHSPFGTA